MPYYHIYIAYTDKKGKDATFFDFDHESPATITERYSAPYSENRPFLIYGRFIQPTNVEAMRIFESIEREKKLLLPNGKRPLGQDNNYIMRCFSTAQVKGVRECTWDFIPSPPREKEELETPELTIGLMKSASFLGLNTNWSLATCALQLQEVAITLVAKRKKIKLDKANVEKVLNKRIQELSFNDQYEAFSRQVKDSFNVEMPILTTDLRKMRTRVLHKGYNPKPEETESIASFTIGLLKKLKDIT